MTKQFICLKGWMLGFHQALRMLLSGELKVSGDYAVGPFTVEIRYLPELIPDAYTEDNVGLFHAVVTAGKVTFSRVKNVFVDKENNRIYGRGDGFSFYVVGILPEETA